MPNIPYVDYNELDEFYKIPQLCNLLGISKSDLRENCKEYGIEPRRNEIGDYGFVKYDVRKLHNQLYHEARSSEKDSRKVDDPWA